MQELIDIEKGKGKEVDSREDKHHDIPVIVDVNIREEAKVNQMIIEKKKIEENKDENVDENILMNDVIKKQEFELIKEEIQMIKVEIDRKDIDRKDRADTDEVQSIKNDFKELEILEAKDKVDIKPVDEAGENDINPQDEESERDCLEDTSDLHIIKIQKNKRTSLAMIEVERFVAEEARKEEEQDAKDIIENNLKLQKLKELESYNKLNGINKNKGININIIKSPKPEDNQVFCFDEYGNRSPAPANYNNSNNSNLNSQSMKRQFFPSENLSVKEWDENSKSPGPSHRYNDELEHGSTSSESSKENQNQKHRNIIKKLESYDENENNKNENKSENEVVSGNSSYHDLISHMNGNKKDFNLKSYLLKRKLKEEKDVEIAFQSVDVLKSVLELEEKQRVASNREKTRLQKVLFKKKYEEIIFIVIFFLGHDNYDS